MTRAKNAAVSRPTVRVDAIRALAASWRATAVPGSDQHNCGVSLSAVLDAAVEPVAVAVAGSAKGRRR